MIFALLSERADLPVDAVIDINPAKQGGYLAATGIRVSAPEDVIPWLEKGSTIHVMNPSYLAEIVEATDNLYDYEIV